MTPLEHDVVQECLISVLFITRIKRKLFSKLNDCSPISNLLLPCAYSDYKCTHPFTLQLTAYKYYSSLVKWVEFNMRSEIGIEIEIKILLEFDLTFWKSIFID